MSRFLGCVIATLTLCACGPSQADIEAAVAFRCERENLEQRIEQDGETPELRHALELADLNMTSVIDASGAPEEVYNVVRAADCP